MYRSGRASQEDFDDLAVSGLASSIRLCLERIVLPTIMDISALAI